MKATLWRALAWVAAILALAWPAADYAQVQTPAPAPFSAPQLEQLVAPIALYPDPLLGQILIAATYPLEVVEAARWLQEPGNADLKGNRLAVALQAQDWDPSVKSLVPFPQILQMMNDQLAWMQRLGDAFLAQQPEVMDAVQRLRARARAAGTLRSTPQAVVSEDGPETLIEPADAQYVYLPAYDPATVYGVWPYPAYPPYYFPLYPTDFALGIDYGLAFAVVVPLWGWGIFDWHHHYLRVDPARFNAINWHRPPVTSGIWQHDPAHRGSVPYRDPATRARFLGAQGSPEAQRTFRGYPAAGPNAGQVPGALRGQAGAGPTPVQPRSPGSAGFQTPNRPNAPPSVSQPVPQSRPQQPSAPLYEAPPERQFNRPQERPFQAPRPAPAVERPIPAPAPVYRPAPPPVFESYGRGAEIRGQAERGWESRQSMPAPAPHGGGDSGGRQQGGGHHR
ncbi:DUF3300 domain-containing protein [Oryzomicrobium sp.]|uniref:DUF3300 domain-containing protein n=1 Tax=Oryzomicrobium sp. TaxID=1911578 RepID=UPI0025F5C0EA|nr:DUF3300 domain-containing protein [Oryzomicrobium sp.]MCE1241912.1 DUF3300 domain-containing protein [Oryzomicrobium sp.]